jgi:hypothetical protein
MGRNCIILGCVNSRKNPVDTVHKFPEDQALRNLWIQAAGPLTKEIGCLNIENHGVCSLHFKDSDYMNPTGQRRKLHLDAVPFMANR